MLVGACFSEGSGMRLSRVTCCLTQFGQARWNGVGVEFFQRYVGGKCLRQDVVLSLWEWPTNVKEGEFEHENEAAN